MLPQPFVCIDRALAQWCGRWPVELTDPASWVAVAFSAGADSTALLMSANRRWPGRVVALHVHHGLQAAADGFQEQAMQTCDVLGIPLKVARVDASHGPGESPEDAARRARYGALARMAKSVNASVVLLGQHADDQAETMMMALGRGAGLPGLSAMGEWFLRHGVGFGRPLLAVSSWEMREALRVVGQAFVDDPSNQDQRFVRNRVRARLMPAWQATFPGFQAAVARTSRHAAQAQQLLEDLARIDLERVGIPPQIALLQSLQRHRQANALRYWLKQSANVAPSEAQMSELLDQVDACRTRGHHIRIKVASGFIERTGPSLGYSSSI
ncbi:MAG: tRNA lysidine(34) synthetase TilS [Burkholderiaceae bacterium]